MSKNVMAYMIVAILSCCTACSGTGSDVSHDTVKKALTPDLVVIEKEQYFKDDQRLVVVVGENHASVKTQIQLANLITRLLDKNLVRAILVEGSNGPFDISRFLRDLGNLPMSETELAAFWRKQLETGRVAGYEYVALTQHGLEIFGVENMGAKARYEVDFQTRAYLEIASSYDRAAVVLERDFDTVSQKAKASGVKEVRSSLGEFNTARSRFAHASAELVEKLKPLGAPQAELIELATLIHTLCEGMNSFTPSYDDYEQWINKAQELYKRHKTIIDRMGNSSTINESDLSSAQIRDLSDLNQLAEKISTFNHAHREDMDHLEKLYSRYSELSKQVVDAQKNLEPFSKHAETANTEMEDTFFITVNALQSLTATIGAPRPGVMSFFREESERQRKENTIKEKPFLAERDHSMVTSIMEYLQKRGKQRVLLIVGYAHLPCIIENLTANNLSFISGKLEASEVDIEQWEEQAWKFRKRADVPIFSSFKLKEFSLLCNRIWKKEQLARLEYFRHIYETDTEIKPAVSGLAGNSRIYEKVGNEDRAVFIGQLPLNQNAILGSHVIDQGAVPGKPEFYQVFDRTEANDQITELSDNIVDFVYSFKTATLPGSPSTYRFKTSAGEKNLKDFMMAPPSNAKYGVLFGEPDEIEEYGLFISPLQSELRGSGPPPPDVRPPWTSAFADPGVPRRPILLRTINVSRARQNLVAIEKQQPSRIGDVDFFEEADLPVLAEKLSFTPSRGDHAQMVVLIAKNTEEFRASIHKASESKLLKGKQVALITCGDAFVNTVMLREDLLRAGVLMVWVNDRQITPESAYRLRDEVKKTVKVLPAEQRKTIEQLMNHSLNKWRKANPNDPNHLLFLRAGSFVEAWPRGCFARFRS